MGKTTFAIKISEEVIKSFKTFCKEHGIKYSFFVEEEELKEDLLDLKTLRKEEKLAIPFEKYLRSRGA